MPPARDNVTYSDAEDSNNSNSSKKSEKGDDYVWWLDLSAWYEFFFQLLQIAIGYCVSLVELLVEIWPDSSHII